MEFNFGFISFLHVGHPQEFATEAALEGLRLPQWCGGGTVAWIVGTLATTGTQGSWWPQAQEICQYVLRFFPSLWKFFLGEDWVWRWHSCLDHGELHGTRCTGMPAAMDDWSDSAAAAAAGITVPFPSLWTTTLCLWSLGKNPRNWFLTLTYAGEFNFLNFRFLVCKTIVVNIRFMCIGGKSL